MTVDPAKSTTRARTFPARAGNRAITAAASVRRECMTTDREHAFTTTCARMSPVRAEKNAARAFVPARRTNRIGTDITAANAPMTAIAAQRKNATLPLTPAFPSAVQIPSVTRFQTTPVKKRTAAASKIRIAREQTKNAILRRTNASAKRVRT